MPHYKPEKWMQFINNAIDQTEYKMMENHLYQCDECLNTYIELIESNIDKNDISIPENFIEEVFAKSSPMEISRNKLMSLYSIAAVITIALYSAGFFQIFIDTLNTTTQTLSNLDISQTAANYNLFQKLNFIFKNGGY